MTQASRWALILGASSGFGAATARALAGDGWNILGVHLDRRSTVPQVDALVAELNALGAEVHFFNGNAADDDFRAQTLAQISDIIQPSGQNIGFLLHSLAFGTLANLVPLGDSPTVRRKQVEMTFDVMANSFVYWVQDVVAAELIADGHIFAMTSEGSEKAWPVYGPVGAAKAALESYVRQLGLELASRNVSVNAVMAGVTATPALDKIPGADRLIDKALAKNPHNRLTRPEDVASALVELARPGTYWLNSNVLRIDGGESSCA